MNNADEMNARNTQWRTSRWGQTMFMQLRHARCSPVRRRDGGAQARSVTSLRDQIQTEYLSWSVTAAEVLKPDICQHRSLRGRNAPGGPARPKSLLSRGALRGCAVLVHVHARSRGHDIAHAFQGIRPQRECFSVCAQRNREEGGGGQADHRWDRSGTFAPRAIVPQGEHIGGTAPPGLDAGCGCPICLVVAVDTSDIGRKTKRGTEQHTALLAQGD